MNHLLVFRLQMIFDLCVLAQRETVADDDEGHSWCEMQDFDPSVCEGLDLEAYSIRDAIQP